MVAVGEVGVVLRHLRCDDAVFGDELGAVDFTLKCTLPGVMVSAVCTTSHCFVFVASWSAG